MVSSVWRSPPRQPRSMFICRIRKVRESETCIGSRIELAQNVDDKSPQCAGNGHTYAEGRPVGAAQLEAHPHERGTHTLAEHAGGGLHAAGRSAAVTGRAAQHGAVV